MSVWTGESEELPGRGAVKVHIRKGAELLSYAAIIRLWAGKADFRVFFSGLLAGMPFQAFRWETPPVTRHTVDRVFECVVLDSPELRRAPELEVFAGEFAGRQAPQVVGFANLGKDAFMIVPCPGEPLSAYAHLAAFVREAPPEQRDRLWQAVGRTMDAQLGEQPIWLNTAGAGVAWLHVRLDSRPKYYHHAPYRSVSA